MRKEELIEPLKVLVSERPTYGYRRIWALLKAKLKKRVNHKMVYRLSVARKLASNQSSKKTHKNA